jgi:hypothetical protein
VVLAVLVAVLPLRTVSARPHEDRREIQGRTLFAKGDYQAALDVYATLFAEKGDPVYLRNIGRCYQKLGQPDKAIDSFREYLRRGHVKGGEREEVDGFIKEMEDLRKQTAATAPPPAEPGHADAPPTESPAAAPPLPAVTEASASTTTSAPGATLTQQAAEPASDSDGSIASRWWFWTALGVLVAGGATTAYLLARPHNGVKPPCLPSPQMPIDCP